MKFTDLDRATQELCWDLARRNCGEHLIGRTLALPVRTLAAMSKGAAPTSMILWVKFRLDGHRVRVRQQLEDQ